MLNGRIRARRLREGGGNCLKYLRGGGADKRGRKSNDFKRRRKLGQCVGALIRGVGGWGEAGTRLRTIGNVLLIRCC